MTTNEPIIAEIRQSNSTSTDVSTGAVDALAAKFPLFFTLDSPGISKVGGQSSTADEGLSEGEIGTLGNRTRRFGVSCIKEKRRKRHNSTTSSISGSTNVLANYPTRSMSIRHPVWVSYVLKKCKTWAVATTFERGGGWELQSCCPIAMMLAISKVTESAINAAMPAFAEHDCLLCFGNIFEGHRRPRLILINCMQWWTRALHNGIILSDYLVDLLQHFNWAGQFGFHKSEGGTVSHKLCGCRFRVRANRALPRRLDITIKALQWFDLPVQVVTAVRLNADDAKICC